MPLSPDQQRTLIALIDRIVPADEFPSASQNGVTVYIERLLQSDLKQRDADVRSGLDSLDLNAIVRHRTPFAELDAAEQDELLRGIEHELFFRLMVTLAGEGYYTDPGNG